MKTILCNTTVQVMGTISWEKAIQLLISEKIVSLVDSDKIVRSPSMSIVVPKIAMLKEYINENHLYVPIDDFSRATILRRDRSTCAYCGSKGSTIDHIVPKSRGGSNKWDNLITACLECNSKKDDKLLVELGWELLFQPLPLTKSNVFSEEQRIVSSTLEELGVWGG